MNPFNRRSLTLRLTWRLSVVLFLILAGAMVALSVRLFGSSSAAVDDNASRMVLDSIRVGTGSLWLDRDSFATETVQRWPNLWVLAVDEKGRNLTEGAIPDVYQPLARSLAHIESSDVRPKNNDAQFSMKIVVEEINGERVHVMIGGAPNSGIGAAIFTVFWYLTPYFVFPSILMVFITVPLVIIRSTRSIARVAGDAVAVDISRDDVQLEADDVPSEVIPLLTAFNKALRRLRDNHLTRERFLTDAAHELRMPIAILEARINSVEDFPLRTPLMTDLLRLSNVAEQLLDLERLGHPTVRMESMDLSAMVRDVASDIVPLALAAGYEVAVEAPPQPVKIIGHKPSLSRVLTNLLHNAIAHGGNRGLIEVAVADTGAFEVRDEGPGIPPHERSNIFMPFYRVRPSSNGSGLGLHLAREIVARHGGRIRVDSGQHFGTVFTVYLSLDKCKAAP